MQRSVGYLKVKITEQVILQHTMELDCDESMAQIALRELDYIEFDSLQDLRDQLDAMCIPHKMIGQPEVEPLDAYISTDMEDMYDDEQKDSF